MSSLHCSAKPEKVPSVSSAKNKSYAPSEGAQRAGAAALARIEQHQRPKVHTSQDAIRNQGEADTHTRHQTMIHPSSSHRCLFLVLVGLE